MGIELVFLYLGLAAAGVFGVNTAVDLIKHDKTIEADKYNSCITVTKNARECRSLENE